MLYSGRRDASFELTDLGLPIDMKRWKTADVCDYTDINECATNNGGCADEASCTNIEGGFTCSCSPGFTGDGFICTGKSV